MAFERAGRRAETDRAEYLPDFCRPAVVLAVVLISELLALVLTLGRAGSLADSSFWSVLASTSLFLLWIGLSGAAVTGIDLEWSDVYLRQTQFGPTEGSL